MTHYFLSESCVIYHLPFIVLFGRTELQMSPASLNNP